MGSIRSFARRVVALGAVVSLVAPSHAFAHEGDDGDFGAIHGTVLDHAGEPLGDVCVDAWFDDGDEYGYGWAFTEPDGSFLVTGLHAGDYVVQFADCDTGTGFPPEYFEDAETVEDATLVPVVAGETHELGTASMDLGATITGTVTDDLGDPIEYACVEAERPGGDWLGSTYTEWDGTFTLSGIRGGDAILRFVGCEAIYVPRPVPIGATAASGEEEAASTSPDFGWPYGYLAEYYDDAATREDATIVRVADGATLDGIDVSLDRASGIAITLTDEHGDAAEGVCATVETPGGEYVSSGYGDAGSIVVRHLAEGPHLVYLDDCGGGYWKPQWYDGVTRRERATVVDVPALEAVEIAATMIERPLPDLAVKRLDVATLGLETDVASLPGTGMQREVTVQVVNEGRANATQAGIVVVARTRDGDATKTLLADVVPLGAAETRTFTASLDTTGWVGDVEVAATTCTMTERDRDNNERTARTYSIVGGTGRGFDVDPRPAEWDWPVWCEDLLWDDGPIVLD